MDAEIAAHIQALRGSCDGIACASDLIAMHVVRALADSGTTVPDDIAVIGFDDLPLAEQTIPRLTTISQSIATGARAMVTALFERIGGTAAASLEMQPLLITRDTA